MSKASIAMETLSNARYMDRMDALLTRSLTRLSSGKRMVSPADDPQGVALGEKLTAQEKRVSAAITNVQNATSYLQSADGFIGSMNRMVTRMSELTLLASDVMKNSGDIALYTTEFQQIQQQLRLTIGGTTAEIGGTLAVTKPLGTYNGIVLFQPNAAGLTIATSETPNTGINIPETNFRNGAMLELIKQDGSGNFTLNITDSDAIAKINAGIQDLADERATIGAVSRRFDLAAGALTKHSEDMISNISGIQDVDIARESTRLARYQMLNQSTTAMLAQANDSPRAVLQLLRDVL
jgi:flagellin